DGLGIPGAIDRKTPDLRVVDLRGDRGPHVDGFGFGLHGGILVGLHESHRLEPAAQEPPDQFRTFDDIIGGKDDMGIEMLGYLADVRGVPGPACSPKSVAGPGPRARPVEPPAIICGEPRLHLTQRGDLDALSSPALLARQFPYQPVGERARGRYADAFPLQV